MLLIQEFLKTHSLKELADQHGVYASFNKKGYKASFNYDQVESKESDILAQECRGLILSAIDGRSFLQQAIIINNKLNYDDIIMGETKIISFPLKRFFNFGQGSAANINWADSNLSVQNKKDGTLIAVYFDSIINEWCVSTRSVSEADVLLDNGLYTFRTLFEKALTQTTGLSFNEFCDLLIKDNTYCFELTTPLNTIVVKYINYEITLLAVRNNITGLEINTNNIALIASFIKVPVVENYPLNNINVIIDWVSTLNPLQHEGVVVLDSNFNRIKVKNASYVAFSKLRDTLGASERNCLELILSEKDDDVIPALPQEIVDNLLKIKSSVIKLIKDHDIKYQQILKEANDICPGDKKTFAVNLQSHKELWQAPMFNMYGGKSLNMKDFIFKSKKEGTWANSFLDKILEISKNY